VAPGGRQLEGAPEWRHPPCRDDQLGRYRAAAYGTSIDPRAGPVARLIAATATSAGGIVIRFQDAIPQFVVGRRKRERDRATWTLPKGTPIAGETLEETALREVGEETGLRVRIIAPLDAIDYTFVQRGMRIYKTVHYFLMEPIGGSMEDHDREFEEVRWVSFEEAPALLSFDTERSLVGLAAQRLPEFRSARS
jgi:ADP-ribose pyrophosphatase YjhB (NUDIX family)